MQTIGAEYKRRVHHVRETRTLFAKAAPKTRLHFLAKFQSTREMTESPGNGCRSLQRERPCICVTDRLPVESQMAYVEVDAPTLSRNEEEGKRARGKVLPSSQKREALKHGRNDSDGQANKRREAINAISSNGNTPLMYACLSGIEHVALALIDETEDLDTVNDTADTALMIACRQNMCQVVARLIKRGARVNYRDAYDDTPLLIACSMGYKDVAMQILSSTNDVVVDAQNCLGNTALFYACESVQLHQVARELLDRGANTELGESPLISCCRNGFVDMAKELLMHGAHASRRTSDTYDTCLTLSVAKRNMEMVKLIIRQDWRVIDLPRPDGVTALMLACLSKENDIAMALIEAGADYSVREPVENRNALMIACENGLSDVACKILAFRPRQVVLIDN